MAQLTTGSIDQHYRCWNLIQLQMVCFAKARYPESIFNPTREPWLSLVNIFSPCMIGTDGWCGDANICAGLVEDTCATLSCCWRSGNTAARPPSSESLRPCSLFHVFHSFLPVFKTGSDWNNVINIWVCDPSCSAAAQSLEAALHLYYGSSFRLDGRLFCFGLLISN